jgi:membrane dipeptidase
VTFEAMTRLKLLFFLSSAIISVAIAASNESFKGSDVLDEVPLIDSHNDLPMNLYLWEKNRLQEFNFNSDLRENRKWKDVKRSFTDIPRLRQGKVGGQFWVAYVHCIHSGKDAIARALEQIDVMKRVIKANPNDMMYVTEADQIMEAFKQKKIASMIEIEGGHAIDSRLSVLRMFYDLGVRCMTLTHQCHTPWADAAHIDYKDSEGFDNKKNLTEWGQKVVYEMNRMGMIVDISHVSEGVMRDVLRVTKAPVIFSHSAAFSLVEEPRNVKDEVLQQLKKNNGVIMVYFYPPYTGPTIDDVIGD